MKTRFIYIFILYAIIFQSCVKNIQDDLNSGGWNHERSLLNIKFENQVGKAEIENVNDETGIVLVKLNVGSISDISKVTLENLELSYQATSNIKKGETIDFSNSERAASLIVFSDTGKKREYIIKIDEFRETLEGKWSIDDFVVYGGTGPEYGGGRVYSFMDKPWCWYEEFAPRVEYDNILTFTLEEITDSGNTKGTCINNAGKDGKFADFVFKSTSNPESGKDVDLKYYYRQIPIGESRWVRDYGKNTITFIDEDGKETIGEFELPGVYDMGHNLSVSVENNAFSFLINGVDDWDNIYTDYDVFAKKARRFYVMITRAVN